MPVETSRTVSALKIKDPDDPETYVVLKVIDQIGFVKDRGFQEYVYGFQNWRNEGTRTSRTVEVGESKLKVQRIDTLQTIDENKLYQESVFTFNNNDPPTHLKTHDVKIYATDAQGNKNEDIWIKVRRIDQIGVTDPKEGYQETVFSLNWSSNPDWDYTNLGRLYEQTPPYRLDPFQTIIDTSFGSRFMLIFHGNNQITTVPMAKISEPVVSQSRALDSSDWSHDENSAALMTQLKIAKTANIVASNLRITSSGVSWIDTGSECYYNVEGSILDGLQPDPGIESVPRNWFNGSGSTFYTYWGVAIQVGEDKRLSVSDTRGYSLTPAIAKNGDVYGWYGIGWGQEPPYLAWSPEQKAVVDDAFAGDLVYYATYLAGPGDSDISVSVGYQSSAEKPYSASLSDSRTLYAPVLTQAGGIDSVDLVGFSASFSGDAVQELDNTGFETVDYTFGPFSGGYSYTESGLSQYGDAAKLAGQIGFGVGRGEGYFILSDFFRNTMFSTPYGDFEWPGNPRLHASNGYHVIQSIKIESEGCKYWLDRESYDARLGAVVGDIDSIVAIFLDVKASDIAKLK